MRTSKTVIFATLVLSTNCFFSACKGVGHHGISDLKSAVLKDDNIAAVHEDYWISGNRVNRRMLIITYNYEDWLKSNGDPVFYSIAGFRRLDEDQSIINIKIENLADIVGLKSAMKDEIRAVAVGIDSSVLLQKDTPSGVVRCFLVRKGEIIHLIAIELSD